MLSTPSKAKDSRLFLNPRSALLLTVACAGLLFYAVLITWDLPPPGWNQMQALRGWGTGAGGWAWPLLDPAPLVRWLPLLGCGVGGALLLLAAAQARLARPLALAGLVVLGYLGQLAALWLKQPNANQLLFDRIVNRSFTGYFTSATRISDLSTFFNGYGEAIRVADAATKLCGHCRTHPPGPILFYWLPLQGIGALPADWLRAWQDALTGGLQLTLPTQPALSPAQAIVAVLAGHAILLGAALIVLPLYGLARRLAGPRWALAGAALGLVVPGILVMSPEFDQVYATAAAMLLYLALRGLRAGRGALGWGLAAGGWFAVCLYGSFGLWVLLEPLLVLAGAAGLGALPTANPAPPVAWRHVRAWVAGLALGLVIPWALLWGLGGFDLLLVLQVAGQEQQQGITVLRPYLPWVVFNLVDFLQFAGLPLIAFTLLTLFQRGGAPAVPPLPDTPAVTRWGVWLAGHVNLYSALFWLTLLVLDLSGTVRGEVGRLWLLFVPLALMGVYQALGQGRLGGKALTGLLLAQFAVCVLIGGRWLTP